jgi:uncharacterized protein YidB (DUF937 family)
MQNGPQGQRGAAPSPAGRAMSPITMAVLGLLAYKALKSFTAQPSPAPAPTPAAPAPTPAASPGGSIGDLLKNGLGGLLSGNQAGNVLSNGLNDLLKQFQQSGHGDIMKSWIGDGQNQPVAPSDLAKALGADQIKTLMDHSGLSRDDLLKALSQHLPGVVDALTPNGRVPTGQEVSRAL